MAIAGDYFLYRQLGAGVYDRDSASPDITTPNPLGYIGAGIGYDFNKSLTMRGGYEHFSSLQGFPEVWNSPDEDGYGFNGFVIKIEKRFYWSQ